MRGLRVPHSLYVRAEKRRNQAVLEMRGFLRPRAARPRRILAELPACDFSMRLRVSKKHLIYFGQNKPGWTRPLYCVF